MSLQGESKSDGNGGAREPNKQRLALGVATRGSGASQRFSGTLLALALLVCFWIGSRTFRNGFATLSHRFLDAHQTHDLIQLKSLQDRLVPGRTGRKDHGNRARRLIVVGDIHGCHEELVKLLSKVDFSSKYDHLILLGDIIAKGPDSAKVISLARSFNASCVRGNHEDKMLAAYRELKRDTSGPQGWVTPNLDPENDAEHLAKTLSKHAIDWIANCPLILNIGPIPGLSYAKIVAVHAGLVPGTDLESQNAESVMNMRTMDPDSLEPSSSHEGIPWWDIWHKAQAKLPKDQRTLVLYGHDARTGLNEQTYSIGLDSGCVRGRKLSALVIHGGKGEAKMKSKSVDCLEH